MNGIIVFYQKFRNQVVFTRFINCKVSKCRKVFFGNLSVCMCICRYTFLTFIFPKLKQILGKPNFMIMIGCGIHDQLGLIQVF